MNNPASRSNDSPVTPSPDEPAHVAAVHSNPGGRPDSPVRIHPVVIFPFVYRAEKVETGKDPATGEPGYTFRNEDLEALYNNLIRRLTPEEGFEKPITVMDYKTYKTNAEYAFNRVWKAAFKRFLRDVVEVHSDLRKEWCVDTCQMWYAGLGTAFTRGKPEDVYWLIPGDFNYAKKTEVLDKMREIPNAIRDDHQDFCVGEIRVDINSSKQLIDTYGTYGLLYNWFPNEAQEIRNKTDKPRSEFFAIRHSFLENVLQQRWYAYEQTIVILLQGTTSKRRICKIGLGDVTDVPHGRDTLAAAMQQVERTERVLKLLWREQNEKTADWMERFRVLDLQSEQIRGAALVILKNLLGG